MPEKNRAVGSVQAIGAAKLAYEDEPIPDDIRQLLRRTLAPHPEKRFASAADFKQELDRLLYGGAYSPTTFNLALFMDRLFRQEIEADEAAHDQEKAVDVSPYLAAAEPERTRQSWLHIVPGHIRQCLLLSGRCRSFRPYAIRQAAHCDRIPVRP